MQAGINRIILVAIYETILKKNYLLRDVRPWKHFIVDDLNFEGDCNANRQKIVHVIDKKDQSSLSFNLPFCNY